MSGSESLDILDQARKRSYPTILSRSTILFGGLQVRIDLVACRHFLNFAACFSDFVLCFPFFPVAFHCFSDYNLLQSSLSLPARSAVARTRKLTCKCVSLYSGLRSTDLPVWIRNCRAAASFSLIVHFSYHSHHCLKEYPYEIIWISTSFNHIQPYPVFHTTKGPMSLPLCTFCQVGLCNTMASTGRTWPGTSDWEVFQHVWNHNEIIWVHMGHMGHMGRSFQISLGWCKYYSAIPRPRSNESKVFRSDKAEVLEHAVPQPTG